MTLSVWQVVWFADREVLGRDLGELGTFERARRKPRMPVVLSRQEVRALLGKLEGTQQLIGRFLYGTGLQPLEGLRVRVKDLDFARAQVIVRAGKGDKDRVTMATTQIYTTVMQKPGLGVKSPLDG